MQHKIYPATRRSLLWIWNYTDKKWGQKQADEYIHGLYKAIENASHSKHLWRKPDHKKFRGIFFIIYLHHYIFFREFSRNSLAVINVLHERMNLPDRLKKDVDTDSL